VVSLADREPSGKDAGIVGKIFFVDSADKVRGVE
jgi:hypothetical protein